MSGLYAVPRVISCLRGMCHGRLIACGEVMHRWVSTPRFDSVGEFSPPVLASLMLQCVCEECAACGRAVLCNRQVLPVLSSLIGVLAYTPAFHILATEENHGISASSGKRELAWVRGASEGPKVTALQTCLRAGRGRSFVAS